MSKPHILDELRDLIPPLAKDEREQLEKNIIRDGCREPLSVWKTASCDILLDGHNRLEICERNGIKYRTDYIDGIEDENAAKEWIIRHQIGRRNLTPYSRAEMLIPLKAIMAERAKANQRLSKGRGKKGLPTLANLSDTREEIAKLAGVSHGTLAKVEKIVAKADEETKAKLRNPTSEGGLSINEAHKMIAKAERRESHDEDLRRARQSPELDATASTLTADQSVVDCDLIVTDPPYGILKEEWEPDDLEAFTEDWAARWAKSKADAIFIFWSQRHLFTGRELFDRALQGFAFQHLLIWHYPNNKGHQSRKGFKQTWEPIFFYRRDGSAREIKCSGGDWGGGMNDFDCHVAAVPQTNFNDANLKVHPAQKPIEVFRWIIGAASAPGETICDPFAGSGSSGVAALQLGRKWHGIEIDDGYRAAAEGRVAKYGVQ